MFKTGYLTVMNEWPVQGSAEAGLHVRNGVVS